MHLSGHRHARGRIRLLVLTVVSSVIGLGLSVVLPVLAGGVVTNCGDDSDLSAKLGGGGSVTFGCGPATITLASTKTITQNTTIDGGGVITLSGAGARRLFVVDFGTALTLSNIALVNGNVLTNGGAILNHGTLYVAGSRLANNSATAFGGALFNGGTATVNGSTFSGNSAFLGGAIANVGTAAIHSSQFTANSAGQWGGAFFNDPTGSATVHNSIVRGNSARWGGGLYNYGVAALADSTFSANSAEYGGAIYHNFLNTDLTNVTLSGNTAITAGGALATDFGGTARFVNVTVFGNSALTGGGLQRHVDVQIVLSNTIVANSPGGNCSGGVSASAFSLSSDGTCALALNNTDPLLLPLGDYGGPTPTHLLRADSPALDAVFGAAPPTDQRGVARPQGVRPDIGSVERQASDVQYKLKLYLPLIMR